MAFLLRKVTVRVLSLVVAAVAVFATVLAGFGAWTAAAPTYAFASGLLWWDWRLDVAERPT